MKKLITIIFVLISFIGMGQNNNFPNKPTQSNVNTSNQFIGQISGQKGVSGGIFLDTLHANASPFVKSKSFNIIHTTSDNNTWFRSSDTMRWMLNATTSSNCQPNGLVAPVGSATWNGGNTLDFFVTKCHYWINCIEYFSDTVTVTLAQASPNFNRIDIIGVDTSGHAFVTTGTPATSPQPPPVDPNSQIQLTFIYVPAGSQVPACITATQIYDSGTGWALASDVPSINPTYATAPCHGTASLRVPNAINNSYWSWQNGTALPFSSYPYTRATIKLDQVLPADVSSFLNVSYWLGNVQVSNSFDITTGTFGFDGNNITSCQPIVLPNYQLTAAVGATFDKIKFVINGAPAAFEVSNVYLLTCNSLIPSTPSNPWNLNYNGGTNPAINGAGTKDSVDFNLGTIGRPDIVLAAGGVKQSYDSTRKLIVWDSTTHKFYWIFQPVILADLPLSIYVSAQKNHIKMPPASDTDSGYVTTRAQTFAGQKTLANPILTGLSNVANIKVLHYNTSTGAVTYADSTAVGAAGWSLTGNAGTAAGTNFLGTTDNIDFVGKRNSIQALRLGSVNTSVGVNSLINISSGFADIGIGTGALFSITTGSSNVAIGNNSNSTSNNDNNVTVGSTAGQNIRSDGNVIIGQGAIADTSLTGTSNTIIGYLGNVALATTKYSVGIGFNATPKSNQGYFSDSIMFLKFKGLSLRSTSTIGLPMIDSTGTGDVSFQKLGLTNGVTGTLPIANGGTNNGSLSVTAGTIYYGDGTKLVGLAPGDANQILHSGNPPVWKDTTAVGGTPTGTPNAVAYFDGSGNLNNNSNFTNDGSGNITNAGSITVGDFVDVTNNINVHGGGENYIGDNLGSTYFRVSGAGGDDKIYLNAGVSTVFQTGTVTMSAYGAGAATFDASGNITSVSDPRLKNIQGKYTPGLSSILKIYPIIYKWKPVSKMDTVNVYAGFNAQNVKDNLPLGTGQNKEGYLSLQDRSILAALVNSVKELAAQNKKQELEIRSLKKQLKHKK